MNSDPNERLLRAVLEPRKPRAIKNIGEACAAGADPNGLLEDGSTLLTSLIHRGAARAVEALLAAGADPNLRDRNGWTPWMAAALLDQAENKAEKIQAQLLEYGAERSGEAIGAIARAAWAGDAAQLEALLADGVDLTVLATYRVDLVARAITSANLAVLDLLLAHGLRPLPGHLAQAVRARSLEAVDRLLVRGAPVESEDTQETVLMTAAQVGDRAIVERLVAAGADVNRYAFDNIEWTPSHYARQAGHEAVADWLAARMDPALIGAQQERAEARNPKFLALYEHGTSGAAWDGEPLTTDAIVATLERWDSAFGVSVVDAEPAAVTLAFAKLPKDLGRFWRELARLCPDLADDVDTRGNPGPMPEPLAAELKQRRSLTLWWD